MSFLTLWRLLVDDFSFAKLSFNCHTFSTTSWVFLHNMFVVSQFLNPQTLPTLGDVPGDAAESLGDTMNT